MTIYLRPAEEAAAAFAARNVTGSVVMLNLVKFKEQADYSATPQLAPSGPVSGEEAFRIYMKLSVPALEQAGGEILFYGKGGHFLIGPENEYWDLAFLIRQQNAESFFAFLSDPAYVQSAGHRTAAIEDSRLLPLTSQLPY